MGTSNPDLMTKMDQAINWLTTAFPGSTIESRQGTGNPAKGTQYPGVLLQMTRKENDMSLRDKLDISAETWRPNESAKSPANPDHPKDIVGHIIDTETYETDFGPAPALTIQGDDGNVWRWVVVGEVAQKRVSRLNPQVGDEIGVRYLGRVPSPNREDTTYHDWRIVLEKASSGSQTPVQEPLPMEPF